MSKGGYNFTVEDVPVFYGGRKVTTERGFVSSIYPGIALVSKGDTDWLCVHIHSGTPLLKSTSFDGATYLAEYLCMCAVDWKGELTPLEIAEAVTDVMKELNRPSVSDVFTGRVKVGNKKQQK